MCGICGIYGYRAEKYTLERMQESIKHRGPDGAGRFISGNIALGHRRLSIIDIDGGTQPISNETNEIYIVFNGEIYNFIELKYELQMKGHIFKTQSDTEVIIHGYEEWGEQCTNHLNGMFAFAIWDNRTQRLILARDHLGIKPLYYFQAEGTLFFASEIKSLLRASACPREVNIGGLADLFTYRYVPSPKTIFKNIFKLPPGHILMADSKDISVKRFWTSTPAITVTTSEEAIARYQFLLEDAIKLQLRSDVPLGLFLSSGIDSNAILAIMAKHLGKGVHTFTIGFEDGDKTNEIDDARSMANYFGADHSEMIIGPKQYQDYYDKYLWDLEEPVGNETAAAFYFVSKLAREEVKVALTGQGADEPWAGYRRYIGVELSEVYCKLPSAFTSLVKMIVMSLPRNEVLKRGVISLAEPDIMSRLTKIYSFFSDEMKRKLFKPCISNLLFEQNPRLMELQSNVCHLDPLSQILYIDTRANLPDDLLMVNDKTSMANSLETRVPYLDYRIIEFIESLPPRWRLNLFQGKYLHKKALTKWLPKEVVYRKKKGFANPINAWLRNSMKQYVDDCLLSDHSSLKHYFNQDYIKRLINLHCSEKEEYFRHIYLLVSFELWHRTFIENKG
jgi:asparagine synthase (glutamine-hydrolysing)